GSDALSLPVDAPRRRGRGKIAERRDASVASADVGGVPGRAGAVDGVAVGDHDVEEGGRGLCRGDWCADDGGQDTRENGRSQAHLDFTDGGPEKVASAAVPGSRAPSR